MGADLSSVKKVSPTDSAMTQFMRNNYRPLHFHNIHGENIKLIKNKAVACRPEGFCKGIVFSDRPVKVEEPIYIKFLDISTNWSGALRIGFTMNDPLVMKSKLPRYACPDLTSMQGNWAKAIAERLAKKDSVLYYYVDHNGDVHYGIDSEEHGIFFGGVNISGKLWAVLDIYGNTVSVEFMDPSTLNQENVIDASQNNFTPVSRNMDNQNLTSASAFGLNSSVSFHSVHGRNVTLINRVKASRKPGFNVQAYVFTENALKFEEGIKIRISQIGERRNYSLVYGITSCNPSSLNPNDFPDTADDLIDRPEYWIVENDSNVYDVGDTILYSISHIGEVTVMKNGNLKSAIFHVDPTLPLWLFFDLSGSVSAINLVTTSTDANICDASDQLQSLTLSSATNGQSTPGPSGPEMYTECVICYEEQVNCALYKCGHMCMCYDCASSMWKPNKKVQCPICRELIQDVIRIYK